MEGLYRSVTDVLLLKVSLRSCISRISTDFTFFLDETLVICRSLDKWVLSVCGQPGGGVHCKTLLSLLTLHNCRERHYQKPVADQDASMPQSLSSFQRSVSVPILVERAK